MCGVLEKAVRRRKKTNTFDVLKKSAALTCRDLQSQTIRVTSSIFLCFRLSVIIQSRARAGDKTLQ